MLKPTWRKSGSMHATVRHSFHPGRGFVIACIAGALFFDRDDNRPPTKADVEEAVRNAYLHEGLSAEMSVFDNLGDIGEEDEAMEWAEEQLGRLWPEWVK